MSHRPIVFTVSFCLLVAASCTKLNPASQDDAGAGGATPPDSSAGSGGMSGSGGKQGAGGTGMGGAGMGGAGVGGAGMGGAGVGGAGGSTLSAGCALIMHMDETSWNGSTGEVHDSCRNNNGTAVRAVSSADTLPSTTGGSTGGRYKGAGIFVDSGGCVEVADDASLDATSKLTVAAWIFPTGLSPASNGIVGKRADYLANSSYTLFVWNNMDVAYHLYADIGTDRFNGSQPFVTNSWYHVAVVFDGTLPETQRVRLYVNGLLDGEFDESATSLPVFATPVHVGCMPAGTPPYAGQEFVGKLDEVAIWTRALSAAEIMSIASSTTPL